MVRKIWTLSVAALALAFVGNLAWAAAHQDAAEGAIKYRQSVMKSVGGHMGAMGGIAKGEVPHNGHMAVHAKALSATLDLAKAAFETKTSGGKTTATDKIWTDWAGFAEKADEASKAANVLVRTIENQGDVGGAMKALGKTCGGCHKGYRKKKKEM